ncbi:MAG: NAD(P)H-dependent oxidoreductase subunit E, partial [Brevinematales bacterium]
MKTLDRINDYSALLDRQAAYQSLIKLRNKNAGKSSRSSAGSYDIMVCGGTGCVSSDSILIAKNLSALVKEKKLSSKVRVIQTGCFGFCERGPVVVIQPDDVFYTRVTPADAAQIIETHIIKGVKVDRLLYKDPSSGESLEKSADIPFYKKQTRIALRNCGLIDLENIMEYIACGG